MAIGVQQAVKPEYLIRPDQWAPQGWSVLRQGVTRQIASNAVPRLTLDAFEWVDVRGFGVANTDAALAQLRQQIQRDGSDLYAYALFKRQVVNINWFGIQVGNVTAYRLVLLHSFVQFALAAAALLLAATFAAAFFIQYVSGGQSPALQDVQKFWGGLITTAGDAGSSVTSGLSQPFVWMMLAGGVAAIAFAQADKAAGVKTKGVRPPSGSIGVKTGPVNARVGT